jgi:hypothetical protein
MYEGFWGLWVGALKGDDTLVSTAVFEWDWDAEFSPDESGYDKMRYLTTLEPDNPANRDAVSEQDFVAIYTDTATAYAGLDDMDQRPHRPLGILVKQKSYAWSYAYAEDFVLFDFDIWNISDEPLNAVYLGFEVFPRIYHKDITVEGKHGDLQEIMGFLRDNVVTYDACSFVDTLNIAWHAQHESNRFPTWPESATLKRMITSTSHITGGTSSGGRIAGGPSHGRCFAIWEREIWVHR